MVKSSNQYHYTKPDYEKFEEVIITFRYPQCELSEEAHLKLGLTDGGKTQ